MQCHVQIIVLPVLCYGAEVWGIVKSEEIEKIQSLQIYITSAH